MKSLSKMTSGFTFVCRYKISAAYTPQEMIYIKEQNEIPTKILRCFDSSFKDSHQISKKMHWFRIPGRTEPGALAHETIEDRI
jgi:hypothetical protein